MRSHKVLYICIHFSFCPIESRSLANSSSYDHSDLDKSLSMRSHWTDWSPCSATCGTGYQTRTLCRGSGGDDTIQCHEGEALSREVQSCGGVVPCPGEWSEWGQCDERWGVKTRTRCQEAQCEEEYLDCAQEEVGNNSWSEWGPCTQGVQERMKCMGEEYGCDVEEQDCAEALDEYSGTDILEDTHKLVNDEIDEARMLTMLTAWSDWDPCQGGYQSRTKCVGDVCELEERECLAGREYGEWSPWSTCHAGVKVRTVCREGEGCIEEEISCGEGDYSGSWSRWGPCKEGYQARERCVQGYGCTSEERQCGRSSDWSEWSECTGLSQQRERCGYDGCEEESRDCVTDTFHWSSWGPCKEGSEERRKCDGDGCVTEERPCSYDRATITDTEIEDSTQESESEWWWVKWFSSYL